MKEKRKKKRIKRRREEEGEATVLTEDHCSLLKRVVLLSIQSISFKIEYDKIREWRDENRSFSRMFLIDTVQ